MGFNLLAEALGLGALQPDDQRRPGKLLSLSLDHRVWDLNLRGNHGQPQILSVKP